MGVRFLLVWVHAATAVGILFALLRALQDTTRKEQARESRITRFLQIHDRMLKSTQAATDDDLGEYTANLTKMYKPFRKHDLLFSSRWPVEWFDQSFVELTLTVHDALDARATTNKSIVDSQQQFLLKAQKHRWIRMENEGVFSFPMFSQRFCDLFLEEVDNYDETGLPAPRPNSMNNYGIIVNLIGMKTMIDVLQQALLQPLAALLFPGPGDEFDRHHAFMVRYKPNEVG
jgi:hypothetical protein